MVSGGIDNDLALVNEKEEGDGAVVPELVDVRIEYPNTISKLNQVVVLQATGSLVGGWVASLKTSFKNSGIHRSDILECLGEPSC